MDVVTAITTVLIMLILTFVIFPKAAYNLFAFIFWALLLLFIGIALIVLSPIIIVLLSIGVLYFIFSDLGPFSSAIIAIIFSSVVILTASFMGIAIITDLAFILAIIVMATYLVALFDPLKSEPSLQFEAGEQTSTEETWTIRETS